MPESDINQAKQAIRLHVWDVLERSGVTEPGVRNHIPAFSGAEITASTLAALPEWEAARVIKAVPDRAQHPIRERALRDGKLLYMAVPRLAESPPFYELDLTATAAGAADLASPEGAARLARRVGPSQMRPVDMVVCGSVAVNRAGTRLGKGAGYSDLEVGLLSEAGLIGPTTVIVTTVHPLQVLDEAIPEAAHDFSVDVIVTTTGVIRCHPPRRPAGLNWDLLPAAMIAAIPLLAERQKLKADLAGPGGDKAVRADD
jgi:5-formyltetrahydrofolate cyclo-ligase